MVNSGTGHDRCPFRFPGPSGAREPSRDGDLENKKAEFWFQEGWTKNQHGKRSLLARLLPSVQHIRVRCRRSMRRDASSEPVNLLAVAMIVLRGR